MESTEGIRVGCEVDVEDEMRRTEPNAEAEEERGKEKVTPRFIADFDEVGDLGVRVDRTFREVFHIRPEQRMLAHSEVRLGGAGAQEIAHALAIDLHVTHLQNQRIKREFIKGH